MPYSQAIRDKLKTLTDTIDVHPGSARVEITGYRDEAQALNPGAYTLEFSSTKGSLFDISKIVDHLRAGELIAGKIPDLEAMFYETTPSKPFQIGSNVQARVNHVDKFQLEFTPTKPEAETLAGLDAAIESARSTVRRKNQQAGAWEEKVRKDEELDRTTKPVFGVQEDVRVVSEYITARVEAAFPASNPRVEYKPKGLMGKPEFSVKLDHTPGEGFTAFNDFHPSLGKVFDGVSAVHPNMLAKPEDSEIGFTVTGNPARLIGDIKRNDPDNLPQGQLKVG